MDEQEVKAKIFYFCRERLYNCMLSACQDGINKFRGELSLNLYKGLALILCKQFGEGSQELETLRSENDYRLAVAVALMHTYKNTGSKDLLKNLDYQIREFKKNAVSVDLYNTAFVLFAFQSYEKAHEYVEKALSIEPSSPEILSLKGWIELYIIRYDSTKNFKASEAFELSVKDNKRNLDSSLGLAESYLHEKNFEEAVSILNKAVVRFPSVHLALIEKMKLHFSLQDWDQCLEVMKRIVVLEKNNLEVLKTNILILICNHAKYEEAINVIRDYFGQVQKVEPKNGDLLVKSAQLFSRVCGRNTLVLTETYKMVEKALEISNNNIEYMIELAYQCILRGSYNEALHFYKAVSKLEESSIDALIGITFCELLQNGKVDQLKHQIDFLIELQETNVSSILLFMQAKLSNRSDSALNFLSEICEKKLKSVCNIPYSAEYLLILDPDFLLNVTKELLLHVPQSSALITKNKHLQKPNAITKQAENVLKIIVKACTGLQEALYLLSKVQFLNGDVVKAKYTLDQILNNSDFTFGDSYLLMAQIQLYIGQYERAAQSLEVGLSQNFKVRQNPLYHFISGVLERNRNNLDDAIKSFTTALQLTNDNLNTVKKDVNLDIQLSLVDKASIYFELIDIHMEANQIHEAMKLVDSAVEEFRGTSEESRIMLFNADQAVQRNEIQTAIDILNSVQPDNNYYLQAKSKLANILLEYHKDSRGYLKCYQEIVDNEPGAESYLLLGDAYLQILDIRKSLDAYEKALQTNPKDPYLSSKMGNALVKTHFYSRAISYYKDAIKSTDNTDLKLQLTDLYIKLQQLDNAENLLMTELESETMDKDDIITLQYKTNLMTILSDIYRKNNNILGALKTLKNARENQNRIIKRLSIEETDVSEEQMNIFKNICTKLSELSVIAKDNEGAIQYYKEILSLFPNNQTVLTDLAKLYMQMNNLELCHQTCAALMKINPDNEEASVMMADIAFRKVDFDMSLLHFTHLLSKQPTNWKALVRFIEVLRRIGQLDEAPQYLQQAEPACDNDKKSAGFYYCTALYQWYSGNLNGALRNFNNVRIDVEWGKKAICNMIEICLNPEDELLGEHFLEGDDSEYRDSRSMALKTADRLLKELKQKSNGVDEENLKYRLLGNFLLLSTKEKINVEIALEDFTTLASNELYREEIGPILGMATAYTILKQGQRAKNQLKRVVKTVWSFEDAEYLERCWLLLADYYIQSSKYDSASELLKRTLQHNKACTKAYEFSGFIAEKEQSYKDACHYYDCAWKYGGRTNPSVGYKLAFNFLKCKRYADAIDICQQVLKNHPDYPRIKKDILEKSLNNLRT